MRGIPWRRVLVAVLAVLFGATVGTAYAAFSGVTSNGANNFSAANVDGTAPTISRAIAVKTSGATPGTIRQGGDYYVYAEVTDDQSVASVTVDTSSFDSGVTGASLTTTGGPWTIGASSYNYRSAVLTANTPLTTGSTYSYTVAATDGAGNPATPFSASVTVETYNSVIAGTSGLVSYWRLGDGAQGADEFTDTTGTVLSSHTGWFGETWTQHSSAGALNALITNEGRIRKDNASGAAHYYSSTVPALSNYAVEADLHVKTLVSGDSAGIMARLDPNNTNGIGTNYLARYEVNSGTWQIRRHLNNVASGIGTNSAMTLSNNTTYRLRMEVNGNATTTVSLYVNGNLVVSGTDTSPIAGPGRAGVRLGQGSMTNGVTDSTGIHIDNFRVTSLTTTAADSKGSNTGTYTNGPRLNEPGAVVGSTNRAAWFDNANDLVNVADAASLDLGNTFSLEAWVKRSSLTDGSIFDKNTGAYEMAIVGNRLALHVSGSGMPNIVQSTTTLNATDWYHLVITKSGTTSKLYINGNDVTGTVTDQNLVNNANPLYLDGVPQYHGYMDELAIYNTAIDAATVLDHYKAGTGTG